MPTYDAVHIKYLLDGYEERAKRREELNNILDEQDMHGLECLETVQLEKLMARDFVDMKDMRDQLLAATQEVERLRKLVGEACNIGERHIFAPDLSPGSPRHEIKESWSLSVVDTTKPHRDKDRLAAIRHAAGPGKGE